MEHKTLNKEHGKMRITKITERWFDVENDPDKSRLKIKHMLTRGNYRIFLTKSLSRKLTIKKTRAKKENLNLPSAQNTEQKT
jgi:hypothetical protein